MAAMSEPKVRLVRCPRCGGDSVYAGSNPFRPFCSERCKSADFGAWASEGYVVPERASADEEVQDADPPRRH
jgi:endogenous inhibitor of DNA gyrase (YacG/DUF329 family)